MKLLHSFYHDTIFRKNFIHEKKINKKNEQHKLHTLFTIHTSNIVGKTNQVKHNSLLILLIYSASNITYLGGHVQKLIHY